MKQTLLVFLLFFSLFSYSQENALIDQNGIKVTYTLTKLNDGEKKDTYLLNVKAVNNNAFDVFYQGPKNGVNPFFCEITVRKVDSYLYLSASQSKLLTADGRLHYLRPNDVVTGEKEFKAAKGEKPIITGKFFSQLRPISDFL